MKQHAAHNHLPEERDGFRFRGGNNAIDLPATLQARLKPTPRELLKTPDDLARWLVAAGLASIRPAATEEDLALAQRLREAIYVLAQATLPDGPDPAPAVAVINEVATGPAAVPQLILDGEVVLVGSAAALIATLAQEAVRTFGGEAAAHIRQCQSPTCTLFFVDTSRSGERRWCSMSGCGNKAKVADFRRRQREAKLQ